MPANKKKATEKNEGLVGFFGHTFVENEKGGNGYPVSVPHPAPAAARQMGRSILFVHVR